MPAPMTFYNGHCPVCSAGIAHIRRLTGVSSGGRSWVDITAQPAALIERGVTVEAVKKRLHVVDRHGVLRVGIPACAALWDEIPRYRALAALVRMPVVREISAAFYEGIAIILYAWNKRRERRQALACRGGSSTAPSEEERS